MFQWWWQAGLVLLSALISFCSVAYWTNLARRDKAQERALEETEHRVEQARHEREDILARLIKIETSLAVIDQKVMPISTALQTILVKELTHFHTPRMDSLLARIGPPSQLTDAEEEELTMALFERTQDMGDLISDSERDAAFILPAIMRRAKIECALLQSVIAKAYVLKYVAVDNLPDK